jgi:hypothetical protein
MHHRQGPFSGLECRNSQSRHDLQVTPPETFQEGDRRKGMKEITKRQVTGKLSSRRQRPCSVRHLPTRILVTPCEALSLPGVPFPTCGSHRCLV